MKKIILLLLCFLPLGYILGDVHNFYITKQALLNWGIGYEYDYNNRFTFGINLWYPKDMDISPKTGFQFYQIFYSNFNASDVLIYQKVETSKFISPDIRFQMKINFYYFNNNSYLYSGIYYQYYSQLEKGIDQIPLVFNSLNNQSNSITIPPMSYTLIYNNTQEYGLLLGYYKKFNNKMFFSIYMDYFYERLNIYPDRVIYFPKKDNYLYNSKFFIYNSEHFYSQSILLKNIKRFNIERNGTNGLGILFGISI
ncbi:MAG: hypothetical protein KatS3mg129_2482 [Leptospiraceae bacterium]|nr:MAG: hypothetical protein KatS3mg129_2482 [Leptospiraceae bacterium]